MIALIDGKQVNTFSNLSLICPYCGHSEFVSCDTFDEQTLDDTEQEARNDVVENERCGYITTTKIEWEE